MILVSAYCAVLFSFASGLLALIMNQRDALSAATQYGLKKFFNGNDPCRDWVNKHLEERRYPAFLRLAVFILLGLSGVQPDLVEHAAEVDEATDLVVATAESGNVGHGPQNSGINRQNPEQSGSGGVPLGRRLAAPCVDRITLEGAARLPPTQKRGSLPEIIRQGRQQPEQEGRGVDPKLMERHGVVVHRPDDGHVLDRDQDPADQNDPFQPRIAGDRPADVHLRNERPVDAPGGAAGLELEKVGKHPGETVPRFGQKKSRLARRRDCASVGRMRTTPACSPVTRRPGSARRADCGQAFADRPGAKNSPAA